MNYYSILKEKVGDDKVLFLMYYIKGKFRNLLRHGLKKKNMSLVWRTSSFGHTFRNGNQKGKEGDCSFKMSL